jgi:hypothetical protein
LSVNDTYYSCSATEATIYTSSTPICSINLTLATPSKFIGWATGSWYTFSFLFTFSINSFPTLSFIRSNNNGPTSSVLLGQIDIDGDTALGINVNSGNAIDAEWVSKYSKESFVSLRMIDLSSGTHTVSFAAQSTAGGSISPGMSMQLFSLPIDSNELTCQGGSLLNLPLVCSIDLSLSKKSHCVMWTSGDWTGTFSYAIITIDENPIIEGSNNGINSFALTGVYQGAHPFALVRTSVVSAGNGFFDNKKIRNLNFERI